MDPSDGERARIDLLVRLAREVRGRLVGVTTEGLCRDVCLATALATAGCGLPFAVCYGEVTVDGDESRSHWWLRHAGIIVDPTADQFGVQVDVLVKAEEDDALPRYVETFYFSMQAERVTLLAGLVPRA